eukprot:156029_1
MEKMNVDDTNSPQIPKMKPQTSTGSTGSAGSGSTMIQTDAMAERLKQLHSMKGGRKGGRKKSYDGSKKNSKKDGKRDRRIYSLANTAAGTLKKMDTDRQNQYKQKVASKNRKMKKY